MKQLKLFESNEKPEKEEKKKFKIDTSLGPETFGMNYYQYMRSEEWQNKRKYAIFKAEYRCEDCHKKNVPLQVHHKHYDSLFREHLEDVVVLCKRCHDNADYLRAYNSSYLTFAQKIHGDDWYLYDDENLQEEFDEWLERKEQEEEDSW
ncbi:MAG: HNH endonuclease [Thermodesulfobacteriota bacterium]